MKTAYCFPIIVFLFLTVFLMGMPNLLHCPLPAQCSCGRKADRKDLIILLLVCAVYAGVAYTALGDTQAPETFAQMSDRSAVIDLGEEKIVSRLVLYSGVGEGSYVIEHSADGEIWQSLASFEQSYISVFKWNKLEVSPFSARFLRITGRGPVFLGELAALDQNDLPMALSSDIPEITDEQSVICAEDNFLNSTYFDEIYHVRTAWEHLNQVKPYEISHPPLGKLIISLGMLLFGTNPFGWRFMGTFFGILMLPIIYVFAKKLFGGRSVPLLCTLLLATDFMHFVQSRIATIDTYGVFFILLMYLFLYGFLTEDRPDSRRSLTYLALSGLCFGFGAASKWTAIYAGAGLAVLWAAYWITHRDLGLRQFLKNSLFCLVFFVALPLLIYYLSYFPYGIAAGLHGPGMFFSQDYAGIVWDNQQFMLGYHANLVAEHPYSSRWYQWLLDIRPILYYLKYFNDGSRSSFGAFVNPVLCWGGLLSLAILLFCAFLRRDREAFFLLIAYLAQLVPWIFVRRLTFEYHYFPCTIFLVLAMGYVSKLIRTGNRYWKLYFTGLALLSTAVFVLFYPALSGMIVDNAQATRYLGWLRSWPF